MSGVDRIRRFEKTDWYGFAGAQKFENGTEPFISTFTIDKKEDIEVTTIADAQGIEIYVYDDRADEGLIYSKDLDLNSIQAEGELRHLVAIIDGYTNAPDLVYALDHTSNDGFKGFVVTGQF